MLVVFLTLYFLFDCSLKHTLYPFKFKHFDAFPLDLFPQKSDNSRIFIYISAFLFTHFFRALCYNAERQSGTMLFPAGEFIKKGILEMAKIFIDGSYETTGLRIHQRLQSRTDLELISIPYEERHSESARRKDGSTVFRKSAVPKLSKRHPWWPMFQHHRLFRRR